MKMHFLLPDQKCASREIRYVENNLNTQAWLGQQVNISKNRARKPGIQLQLR